MHRFHGSCESITFGRHGFDVAGRVGGVSKCRTDFPDHRSDTCVHVNENVTPPETLDDLLAGHQFAAPFHQQDEEIHRPALEPNGSTLATQLVGSHVELERTEPPIRR